MLRQMFYCDLILESATIYDGLGSDPEVADLAINGDKIVAIGSLKNYHPRETWYCEGLALAPGFIDTHTHDDLAILLDPPLLPKLSQGVTTVVAGNCGISAAPIKGANELPEPINLLGARQEFKYRTFAEYRQAITRATPAVNIAAFVGHTSLRAMHMERLDRTASSSEVAKMKQDLAEAMRSGALGLSTGLAYRSAHSASTEEVVGLARELAESGGIYATHMRTESDEIIEAIEEALLIGRKANSPTIISHLKCAGIDNWGRSAEVISKLEGATVQEVFWDCYPYPASSTVLDPRQIDERVTIIVTRSATFPQFAGRTLESISREWGISQKQAAERLQPAGAIYYSMSEEDLHRILKHPSSMIGSDGLPNDPHPHPRLWGTFPRVLGHFARDMKLFSLTEAIRKMTSLPASRFGFSDRGKIQEGVKADLVLFDPKRVRDAATFDSPTIPAEGIEGVWVNGVMSYANGRATGKRAGSFLPRSASAP